MKWRHSAGPRLAVHLHRAAYATWPPDARGLVIYSHLPIFGTAARAACPLAHHEARGHTLMPCRPQYRQRHICAYQPAPNSSKPSCGVSSPQSRQKWRKHSGRSRNRTSLRDARVEILDQSPSAANILCQRLERLAPTGPARLSEGVRPTRSRKVRKPNGIAGWAIIGCSNEAPRSVHQTCQPPVFRAG
jgi:hypothetical protein